MATKRVVFILWTHQRALTMAYGALKSYQLVGTVALPCQVSFGMSKSEAPKALPGAVAEYPR